MNITVTFFDEDNQVVGQDSTTNQQEYLIPGRAVKVVITDDVPEPITGEGSIALPPLYETLRKMGIEH